MIKFKGNVQGGWLVIRIEESTETLLGEITYLDPDAPDLNVTFITRKELFVDYPKDLAFIQSYMRLLMVDAST